MKINKFMHEEDWLAARRGIITGTRLKDIIAKNDITIDKIKKVLDKRGAEYKKNAKITEKQYDRDLQRILKNLS